MNDDWKWKGAYKYWRCEQRTGEGRENEGWKGVCREGRRDDRPNEMVARGFGRNTHWKKIKEKVVEVMGESRVTHGRVQIIGQMASFAIIESEEFEQKQEFKRWLETNGARVKDVAGIWFGDNINKDGRAWERAVEKVERGLMMEREGWTDIHPNFRRGRVYVGDKMVARLDEVTKVMMFDGEGKTIRETNRKFMVEGGPEVGELSD